MHLLKLAYVPLLATVAASATIQVSTESPSLDRCWEAAKNIDQLLNLYAQYGDTWMGASRDAIGHILQSISEAGTSIKQDCSKLESIGKQHSYQEAERNAERLFGKSK